jgi:cyclomaltodextrinase
MTALVHDLAVSRPRSEPGWVRHALFWHLHPLGFLGAEATAGEAPSVAHRLGGLEPWLDHAVELGASGILLGPVFASRSHGYDTTDHFAVDPRLGDEDDLVAVFSGAHARGLRVVLDGVFNHVGEDFAPYRRALAGGPGSPEARWFRLRWPDPDAPDGGGAPVHDDFEGHQALVALNHDEPAVADHVAQVMTHWLDRGADGWRLDAAYAVPPAFWAPVLARVRERHPEVYVVGETIHGDYVRIVAESGMDAVTQYELWKAIWSSLNDGNFHELAHALGRHEEFVRSFVPLTFVGNHDVTRIASRLDDERHLDHALTVLFTVAGTPCVYAGDDHGFRGVKEEREGGDDAIRPAFPASPAELSPLGLDVFHRHQELISIRRRHPWLHDARTEVLDASDSLIVFRSRPEDETSDDGLVVLLSTDESERSWGLPAGVPAGDGPATLLAGVASLADDGRTMVLPPHGWAVVGP